MRLFDLKLYIAYKMEFAVLHFTSAPNCPANRLADPLSLMGTSVFPSLCWYSDGCGQKRPSPSDLHVGENQLPNRRGIGIEGSARFYRDDCH
jgi:hypothetical protein